MRISLLLALAPLLFAPAHAATKLPPCPADRPASTWTNCHGSAGMEGGGHYTGGIRGGLPHGQGTLVSADGATIMGNFVDGALQGQGVLRTADGTTYTGGFVDSLMHGQGTFALADGSKYVGEFRKGNLTGRGARYDASGKLVDSGVFADGELIAPDPAPAPAESRSARERDSKGPPAAFENIFGAILGMAATAMEESRNKPPASAPAPIPTPAPGTPRPTTTRYDVAPRPQAAMPVQTAAIREPPRAAASETPAPRPAAAAGTGKRVALVIGNAAYESQPLLNPVNDSTDMARELRQRGFRVIEVADASLRDMRRAAREFSDEIVSSDVALVYYSGHGLEVNGRNYLVPVGADIQREYEVSDQAYDATQFTEMMQTIPSTSGQRVNILIVDACRDNNLARSWRSAGGGGLAKMDAPAGTFIAFATAPGKVASDGDGRNSPFTKHLLRAMQQPDQPIEQVFKAVRKNVIEETKGLQVPWENSSLVGDFFFTAAP